jgi:hypothetical protein
VKAGDSFDADFAESNHTNSAASAKMKGKIECS